MEQDRLASTLASCDIAVEASLVEAALHDAEQGPLFSEWARVHLAPDTLLSADELNQYAALERSGKAEELAASFDPASVQPSSGTEIKAAIEELNRSTEAISKHTVTLRQQQDALARLVATHGKTGDARLDLELRQTQNRELNQKHLATDVDELVQSLAFRISDLEQQGKSTGSNLHQTVDGLFRSDDKLLSSLQKLGWELETEDPEEQESVGKLREICARLIKHTVETIRTKLDRLHLEALLSAQESEARDVTVVDDVSSLREELESLYAEVLPVAQMSVEQQFLEPSLRALSGKDGQSIRRSAQAIDYIQACLDFLLDHIQLLLERVETFQAHQATSNALIAEAKGELVVQISTPKKKPKQAGDISPTRRRKSSGHGSGMSPMRTRATPGLRRRSSGAGQADLPALEQLLRNLALALPQLEDAGNGLLDGKAQADILVTTMAERSAKANDVARNVQESFESAMASQLADAQRALRIVRDSVLAESPFGAVQLVDPEIEGSIAVLAQEVGKVSARLEEVGRKAGESRGRSVKRDELIRRWGRR